MSKFDQHYCVVGTVTLNVKANFQDEGFFDLEKRARRALTEALGNSPGKIDKVELHSLMRVA
jgi:hypothetical protein